MQLKQLLYDDDAVSPVIGVILMVAITVILAAVIATFVLGLGDSVSSTAPTATITTEYNSYADDQGKLTVTHDGGDKIVGAEVWVRGNNGSHGGSGDTNFNFNWDEVVKNPGDWDDGTEGNIGADTDVVGGTMSSSKGGDSAVVAGDRLTFGVHSDADLSIIWEPQSGESSATLKNWQGPDAS